MVRHGPPRNGRLADLPAGGAILISLLKRTSPGSSQIQRIPSHCMPKSRELPPIMENQDLLGDSERSAGHPLRPPLQVGWLGRDPLSMTNLTELTTSLPPTWRISSTMGRESPLRPERQ